jgi:hypothetical protein
MRVMEDLGSNRTEQEAAEFTMSPGRQHDQIHGFLGCVAGDRLAGLAFDQHAVDLDAGELFDQETVQAAFDLGEDTFLVDEIHVGIPILVGARRKVHRVKERDGGAELRGECGHGGGDGKAPFGEVDREQDVGKTLHEAPRC